MDLERNEKGDMAPDAGEYDICNMCLIIDDNVIKIFIFENGN